VELTNLNTNLDGLVAAVMPFLGDGSFRFEEWALSRLRGSAFAKAQFYNISSCANSFGRNVYRRRAPSFRKTASERLTLR
jgi:hypothetical protein